MAVASQWPTTFALSLWVVAGRGAYEDDTFASEISPLGLASRPYKHFLVSLRGYGREAVLVGRFSLTFEQSSGRGTAVTALRWNPGDPEPATPALGMWSSSVDNPLVFWDQMPTEH